VQELDQLHRRQHEIEALPESKRSGVLEASDDGHVLL